MQDPMATIQCSNSECQASNSPENQFCDQCGTPVLKRYLWALGDWVNSYEVGQLIGDRYLFKQDKIFLDTKPGLTPQLFDEVPHHLRTYLKLFTHRLHLPQVYSYFPSPDEDKTDINVCLLEYGTIPINESGELLYPNFLPQLSEVWAEATPLRQLNWLWQIAQLWQPLEGHEMVSSLLDPSLLRVNGATLQLLELHKDEHHYHSVKELGKLWLSWVDTASPLIQEFLRHLCEYLQKGKIRHPEYLLTYLEAAIVQCGQWYEQRYQIITATDAGPTRDHNEDTCYPPSGELRETDKTALPFVIVCDGVGGQDGGEIASGLAIDSLAEEIPQRCSSTQNWQFQEWCQVLGDVVCLVNDRISQRNDDEQRQDRQRMGTTLVMVLAHGHEIYLANVGDSRIYCITPTSCHQVTIDDDLASREVRLGYLFYRDAIQYPNAGALVQALGMGNGSSLHPNVQQLIVDEDCVFLLCSDGLSDYDRVDEYWQSTIVPLLKGETDIGTVAKQLIDIGNKKNGHDNVTVGLIYSQVQCLINSETTPLSMTDIETALNGFNLSPERINDISQDTLSDLLPTTPINLAETANFPRKKLLIFLLSGIALAGITYLVWQFRHSPQENNPPPSSSMIPGFLFSSTYGKCRLG
ncbi:protein phosphatase 2C domain-containing protein [Aphanothece sacrum]|uniref:Protein phosphatase n=1 Tax=Aphanothece sacrum FPU1 TaxID=1920663 RepID=A0A401IJD3_APHSA|nr:protein phosphatase 2C domain-containing protein [Aphanothece sacrum]GBF81369.1 protein phosphatase [Aphanothece sacrum FPU1]GBF85440.1 protein phosphatase [Aphanothece sacrum FPU3]